MYDAAEQFFQNQNILPAQFFAGRADSGRIEPLRKLAFAVLIDAVHCFQANFGTKKHTNARQFVEAREWLLGPNGDGPFSFENVCFLVGVDGSPPAETHCGNGKPRSATGYPAGPWYADRRLTGLDRFSRGVGAEDRAPHTTLGRSALEAHKSLTLLEFRDRKTPEAFPAGRLVSARKG